MIRTKRPIVVDNLVRHRVVTTKKKNIGHLLFPAGNCLTLRIHIVCCPPDAHTLTDHDVPHRFYSLVFTVCRVPDFNYDVSGVSPLSSNFQVVRRHDHADGFVFAERCTDSSIALVWTLLSQATR